MSKETAELLNTIDENASVWSMIKYISHALSDAGITYNQFNAIFELIDTYTCHEAEIMAEDLDHELDLEGDDGEWYEIPAIG